MWRLCRVGCGGIDRAARISAQATRFVPARLRPAMLPLRRAGGLWARRRQSPGPVRMVPRRQMNLMPALREVVKLEQVCCPPAHTVHGRPILSHCSLPSPASAAHMARGSVRWMAQLAKEPTETVREIWDLRHKEDPERVGAIISSAAFQEMWSRVARQCVPCPAAAG